MKRVIIVEATGWRFQEKVQEKLDEGYVPMPHTMVLSENGFVVVLEKPTES